MVRLVGTRDFQLKSFHAPIVGPGRSAWIEAAGFGRPVAADCRCLDAAWRLAGRKSASRWLDGRSAGRRSEIIDGELSNEKVEDAKVVLQGLEGKLSDARVRLLTLKPKRLSLHIPPTLATRARARNWTG